MNIEWTSAIETGNALIDSEHKILIKNINDLFDACSKGAGRAKVAESAKFLSDYTKTHFSHEEQLQVKHKYPKYSEHQKWHKDFSLKIEPELAKLKTGEPTIATVAQINTLIGLLVSHIKSADVALAKYIKENS